MLEMSKKPKKRGVKALMELLGADPNESPPNNFEEARFRHELERQTVPVDPVRMDEMPRCQITGKVGFSSEPQAKKAARSRLNRGSNVSKLRVYRCEHCGMWHMSSNFRR